MIDRGYNHNWWSRQIWNLVVMKIPSSSCNFLLLQPAVFPQEQSLLKFPESVWKITFQAYTKISDLCKIPGLYKNFRPVQKFQAYTKIAGLYKIFRPIQKFQTYTKFQAYTKISGLYKNFRPIRKLQACTKFSGLYKNFRPIQIPGLYKNFRPIQKLQACTKISDLYKRACEVLKLQASLLLTLSDVELKTWSFWSRKPDASVASSEALRSWL